MHAAIVRDLIYGRSLTSHCHSTGPEAMAIVRMEYLRLRNEQEENKNPS